MTYLYLGIALAATILLQLLVLRFGVEVAFWIEGLKLKIERVAADAGNNHRNRERAHRDGGERT